MKQASCYESRLFAFSNKSGKKKLSELAAGRHTFNFMFLLAEGAPSSVELNNAHIRYRIRVICDRPWKFDLKYEFAFTVIRPINLNLDPQLKMPMQHDEVKTFCCLFCKSNPILITVSIPQTGFVVGQAIPIKVSINNQTSYEIRHVEFIITKYFTYTSQTPYCKTKFDEVRLHKMFHGSSFHSCNKEYDVDLEVPFTDPSTCNPLVSVLNIHYKLSVKIKV